MLVAGIIHEATLNRSRKSCENLTILLKWLAWEQDITTKEFGESGLEVTTATAAGAEVGGETGVGLAMGGVTTAGRGDQGRFVCNKIGMCCIAVQLVFRIYCVPSDLLESCVCKNVQSSVCGHLGRVLGSLVPSRACLGPSRACLEPALGHLGLFWDCLGRSWAVLGQFWFLPLS